MPPKIVITKEEIIDSALKIVRERGIENLNARAVAKELGCSTQPIFSNYNGMEDLKKDLIISANKIYNQYIEQGMKNAEKPYKGSGLGYIRFAREETNLFKLLFMRDRQHEVLTDGKEELKDLLSLISKNTGMTEDEAYLFHIKMWIFAHGLATMVATNYLKWDEESISNLLTSEYKSCVDYYTNRKGDDKK